MQIIKLKIDDVKPYEKNPRKNDNAVDKVAESIKQFGFKVPLVIDKDNIIIAGHTRYKAAIKLGLSEVPCIIADDLTPKQIKAFRLADNKVAEFSEWDFDLLTEELNALDDWDMSEFGFKEIEREFNHIDDLLEDGFGLDEQVKESDIFGITFNFPIEHREVIDRAIKDKTKQYFVDLILDEVLNNGD